MGTVHLVDTADEAVHLAGYLNGDTRRKPTAVVTVPAGRAVPWIDAEAVAAQAGNLADVYLIPTGAITWEFSRLMADGTQVYGGAGRVYPVGLGWITNLSESPLRFAFNAGDGQEATNEIISDALRMAMAAGLLARPQRNQLRAVSGTVRWVTAGRAAVDIGAGTLATIAEELTTADVAIGRLVTVGQRLDGTFDELSRRLDVSRSLRPAEEALAGYAVGDVVLARVQRVAPAEADLILFPRTTSAAVVVRVARSDVTSNPADDLTTLMTVGEVIPARVTAVAPGWALSLLDVDDDEPIVAAPALLPEGPAWLVEDRDVVAAGPKPTAEPDAQADRMRPPPPPAPAPTPGMFDRNRRQPAPQPRQGPAAPAASEPAAPAMPKPSVLATPKPTPTAAAPAAHAPAGPPAASNSTKLLLRKIDALTAEASRLEAENEVLKGELAAGQGAVEQVQALLDQAEKQAARLAFEVKQSRARLRKAGKARPEATQPRPTFADPERGFRFLVEAQWATRIPAAEQRERPLGPYTLGPRFLASLAALEGIKDEKVAAVVVEIVTGIAPRVSGREVHQLRTGAGGGDPVRTRPDGAVAWRASLQVNTPSARRIHYWVLPDQVVELACVATHDSFDI